MAAKGKSTKIETELKLDRDTKGTFVYKNAEDDAPVPSLYVKKSAFSGDAPKKITLTIEEA